MALFIQSSNHQTVANQSDINAQQEQLINQGIQCFSQGQLAKAHQCFSEALAIARKEKESPYLATILHELSIVERDTDQAMSYCMESIDIVIQHDREPWLQLLILCGLQQKKGNFLMARNIVEQLKDSAASRNDLFGYAQCLSEEGLILFQEGQKKKAVTTLIEAILLKYTTGNKRSIQNTLHNLKILVDRLPHPSLQDWLQTSLAKLNILSNGAPH